jgi:hypothetical protein
MDYQEEELNDFNIGDLIAGWAERGALTGDSNDVVEITFPISKEAHTKLQKLLEEYDS